MVSETVQVSGHILDSLILPKILDEIIDLDGTFEILEIAVGKRKTDPSNARLKVSATSEQKLQAILKRLARLGATPLTLRECVLVPFQLLVPTSLQHTPTTVAAIRMRPSCRPLADRARAPLRNSAYRPQATLAEAAGPLGSRRPGKPRRDPCPPSLHGS